MYTNVMTDIPQEFWDTFVAKALYYTRNIATPESTVDDLLDYLELPFNIRTAFGVASLLKEVFEVLDNSATE